MYRLIYMDDILLHKKIAYKNPNYKSIENLHMHSFTIKKNVFVVLYCNFVYLTFRVGVTSHSRIWQRRVSLTSLHFALLLVTRLEMPNPQEAEHSVHSVVCGKHSGDGNGIWKTGREAHSEWEKSIKKQLLNASLRLKVFIVKKCLSGHHMLAV